jgi:hypothetical protein
MHRAIWKIEMCIAIFACMHLMPIDGQIFLTAAKASEVMAQKQYSDNPKIFIAGYADGRIDAEFDTFVRSITDYIRDSISPVMGRESKRPQLAFTHIRFTYFPVFNRSVEWEALSSSLDKIGKDEEFYILSPWMRVIRNKRNGLLRADFIWNEHQFLVDQELLDSQDLTHLRNGKMDSEQQVYRFIDDYEDTVLNVQSGEEREAAINNARKRIPSELLWLITRAWQSTFGPFSNEVRNAMRELVVKVAPIYIQIIKDTIDLCVAQDNRNCIFPNIILLETSSNIKLDVYDIDKLH